LSPLTSRASFSSLFLSFCQIFTIGQPKKKGYDLYIGVFGKKNPKVAIFQEERKS
jgi:hypothetical protein